MSTPSLAEKTIIEEGVNHHEANPPSAHLHVLIEALESIILPIVRTYAPELANQSNISNGTRSHLEPEAQQLLVALERFIDALVRPKLIQRSGIEDQEGLSEYPEAELDLVDEAESSLTLNFPSFDKAAASVSLALPEQPRLLKLALEEARQRIFNKMPIRLLAFKPDGSGIELLERSEIWEHISTLLEVNFDEEKKELDTEQEEIAIDAFVSKHVRYAILSHTWLSSTRGEVVYSHWNSDIFEEGSPGYEKLANFCRVAAMDHKITLAWMDTICINKESSTELDESIRSMYKWYSEAEICITYLAQTTTLQDMRVDPWFTRGWTLQELLAPRYLKFYSAKWEMISSNNLDDDRRTASMGAEIEAATTITLAEFNSFRRGSYRIPISRRMEWAANRRVTREEDIAYSLMGVFNISFSIAYGEGSERAFFRLVKKILKSTKRGLDVVNWGFGREWRRSAHITHPSSLIPSSPRHYIWRSNRDVIWFPPTTPITLTHLGLHLSVLLMPATLADSAAESTSPDPIGSYYATVSIIDAIHYSDSAVALNTPKHFNLLDKASKRSNSFGLGTPKSTAPQRTFGVLNFSEQDKDIFLPDGYICFAICLYPKSQSGSFERMPTVEAVSFPLRQVRSSGHGGHIPKSELGKHGMQLVTMYL